MEAQPKRLRQNKVLRISLSFSIIVSPSFLLISREEMNVNEI